MTSHSDLVLTSRTIEVLVPVVIRCYPPWPFLVCAITQ